MTTNINADNGVVSGVAGLKTSADNSGVLALQTNGTTALTVNASQAIGVGSTPSYGTSGQVLTSAGSGASPTWTTATASQWTTSGSDIYYTTGQVWINKTSNVSGARLQTQGATDSAFTAFTVNAATNDGYMGIGYSSSGSVWQIWPTYNATAGYKPLAFVVGGSEVARFPTASGFQCVNSISVGNATPTTSGAGITFPATQSASSDANTLDDYEEGTWTPTITPETGSFTTTSYTSANCTYVKIGKQVVCNIRWQIDSFGTGAGGCKISGLPFAIGSSQRGSSAGLNGSNSWALSCLVYSDGNYVSFYKYDGTFTSGDFQGKSLAATITYFV